jgi:hypothetical protein
VHGGTSKHDSCAKNSSRLFTVTRHISGEYISVSNGKRLVSNVNKRAKMFAVCAWMKIAVQCFLVRHFRTVVMVFMVFTAAMFI